MSTPQDAVHAWWQAMQTQDLPALAATVTPDYLSSGGPTGRSIGRDHLLAEAAEFFAGARIDDWSIADMEVRHHDDAAVCSYVWAERGSHNGQEFAMRGLATDVLVRQDGVWRHQAHHVSMLMDG